MREIHFLHAKESQLDNSSQVSHLEGNKSSSEEKKRLQGLLPTHSLSTNLLNATWDMDLLVLQHFFLYYYKVCKVTLKV